MKINRVLIIMISFGCFCSTNIFLSTVYADIHKAATCSYSDVSNAINSASSGDIVIVPAGTCTWTNTLTISKGINIQGSGIGSTVIVNGLASASSFLIVYKPSSPSSNDRYSLSGFTFNINSVSQGLAIVNTDTTKVLSNVRINHNTFIGCKSNTYPCIRIDGQIYGLIDNNYFSGSTPFEMTGGNEDAWNSINASYGTADAMYVEDNNVTITGTLVGAARGIRYVFRYNSVTYTGTNSLSPWFDAHGDQPTNLCATMQEEIYGNALVDTNNRLAKLADLRGGMGLVYFNKTNSTTDCKVKIRDEYYGACITSNSQPQEISNTYIWSNRKNANALIDLDFVLLSGTATAGSSNYLDDTTQNWNFCQSGCAMYGVKITSGTGAGQFRQLSSISPTRLTVAVGWDIIPDTSSTYEIRNESTHVLNENSSFWTQRSGSFDASGNPSNGGGVGCGPLASLPATCTIGVGYWATDQSCSDLTGTTGAKPLSPISGILYKCTAPNTWTAYYTPYTYPHPLRTDDSINPPSGLRIAQ